MQNKKIKEVLRKKYLQKRQNINLSVIKEKSKLVISKIEKFKDFKKAKEICIYFPINKEIDLLDLIKLYPKKIFYIPKISNKNLEFGIYKNINDTKLSSLNIPEPLKTIKKLIPDIVFVPGIVFDLAYCRIGYGKAYFDNYLKNLRKKSKKTKVIGVGMNFQILKNSKIPTQDHDEKMDLIITEKTIYPQNNA